MRTLFDILNELKDNKTRPNENESYHTILVLDTIITFLNNRIAVLATYLDPKEPIIQQIASDLIYIDSLLDSPPETINGTYLPGNELYDEDRTKIKESIKKIQDEVQKKLETINLQLDSELAKELKDEDKLN